MAEEKSFKDLMSEKMAKRKSQEGITQSEVEDIKKEAKDLIKETKKDAETSEDLRPISKMSSNEIFTYLLEKVKDERTSLIIEKAQEEYKELSKRITEAKARIAVGTVLKEVVETKLLAAQGMNRLPKR